MNHKYRKLDKKVHGDLDLDALVVRGKSENRNQGGQRKFFSESKKKYHDKKQILLCHKKGHWRKIALNWSRDRRSRAQH